MFEEQPKQRWKKLHLVGHAPRIHVHILMQLQALQLTQILINQGNVSLSPVRLGSFAHWQQHISPDIA